MTAIEEPTSEMGKGKRRRKSLVMFSPELRRPRQRRRKKLPDQPVFMEEEIDLVSQGNLEESRQIFRCPFGDCPHASAAFPGWLQRKSQIAHINSIHLSTPGNTLPENCPEQLSCCERCQLVLNGRGFPSCKGKKDRSRFKQTEWTEVEVEDT